MSKYSIMTEEIKAIDRTILLLKTQRTRLVAAAAKHKVEALCAETRNRKQSK